MRTACVLLLCLGCSDPEPPPRSTPVTPEPEAPAPEPEAPEAEPDPSEQAPVALELPDEIPVPAVLEVARVVERGEDEGEIVWPRVAHPTPEVRAVLDGTLAGVARELGALGGYAGSECSAHLAHEALVSATCMTWVDGRGARWGHPVEIHLAVSGGRVRPFGFADAFLPDQDPREGIVARCRAELARRIEAAGDERDPWEIEEQEYWCDAPHFAFGPRGLVVGYSNSMNGNVRDETVPYAELRARIAADGPLAPVLADRPARVATLAEGDATGYAVTEFGTEAALVRRWMDAEGIASAPLVVDDYGGGLARIALAGRDADEARRIARALGAEPEPIRVGAGSGRLAAVGWNRHGDLTSREREVVAVRWVRTVEDLNLRPRGSRSEHTSAVVAVLPAGSIVAAVGGELRQPRRFVDVVTARGAGVLASRHLRAHEGCVVAPGPSARHVARVSVRQGGAARDAWLVVSERDGGSHVALHPVEGETCALGEELLGADLERVPFDVRLVGTTEHGGDTLVVIGVGGARDAVREMRYRVLRVGGGAPLLDERLELDPSDADLAVRLGERAGGTYYPVTLERGDDVVRYAWTGGALVAAAAP